MRRINSPLAFALTCVLTCWQAQSITAEVDSPTRFAADRPVDCLHIRLDLEVDVEKKHVKGRATIDLAALRTISNVTLDAVDLSTSAVSLAKSAGEPAPARYTNDGKKIDVVLDSPLSWGFAVFRLKASSAARVLGFFRLPV